MTPRLLEILQCPACGASYTAATDELRCPAGHTVPVVRGVPRFVSGDAYAANFGLEWTTFSTTQLDGADRPRDWTRDLYGHGPVTAAEESARTFRLKTGLAPEDLRGKRVLDVGCGMGRFLDVAARDAAHAVGIDLTRAVDSAAHNLAGRENVDLLQADLRSLPLRDGSFDVIYSIGVLHHTPDTRDAFRGLLRLLKPGGTVAIWVYHRPPWRRPWLPPSHAFSDALRVVTTRLPHGVLLSLCRARARMHDRVKNPLLAKVLRKVIPANEHPDFEWRVLDTFDWYSPRYQWKHTDDEVRGWFEESGLTDVRVLDVPVAVRGRLPA